MNEIRQSQLSSNDSCNISMFLENIAISESYDLHSRRYHGLSVKLSFYTMKNCVIVILSAVVQKALASEDLTEEQREQRNGCLNSLDEHILDCNVYVRLKVLQICQRLCCKSAMP